MKKSVIPFAAGLSALLLLSGCVLGVGSGAKTITQQPTLGQQLVDLQKAKDVGAINDTEFQAQKTKLLQSN
jgi:hypothetical protein